MNIFLFVFLISNKDLSEVMTIIFLIQGQYNKRALKNISLKKGIYCKRKI